MPEIKVPCFTHALTLGTAGHPSEDYDWKGNARSFVSLERWHH
jgi:hypothetical protein